MKLLRACLAVTRTVTGVDEALVYLVGMLVSIPAITVFVVLVARNASKVDPDSPEANPPHGWTYYKSEYGAAYSEIQRRRKEGTAGWFNRLDTVDLLPRLPIPEIFETERNLESLVDVYTGEHGGKWFGAGRLSPFLLRDRPLWTPAENHGRVRFVVVMLHDDTSPDRPSIRVSLTPDGPGLFDAEGDPVSPNEVGQVGAVLLGTAGPWVSEDVSVWTSGEYVFMARRIKRGTSPGSVSVAEIEEWLPRLDELIYNLNK